MKVIGDGEFSQRFGYTPSIGKIREIPEGLKEFLSSYQVVVCMDYYDVSVHCCLVHPNVFILTNENLPYNSIYCSGQAYENRRIIQEKAQHFIAVSRSVEESLVIEGVERDRITTIPFWTAVGEDYGVDFISPEEKKDFREYLVSSLNRDFILLYVGRNAYHKGIELLEEVVRGSALRDKVGLVLVGMEEEFLSENVLRIRKMGRDSLLKYYCCSDLLILPSFLTNTWAEQFGRVLVEAMACGLPAISTDYGGPRDIVVNGETGFLIPPQNRYALEGSVLRLFRDRDLLWRMGLNCISRYFSVFKKDLVSAKIDECYQRFYREGVK